MPKETTKPKDGAAATVIKGNASISVPEELVSALAEKLDVHVDDVREAMAEHFAPENRPSGMWFGEEAEWRCDICGGHLKEEDEFWSGSFKYSRRVCQNDDGHRKSVEIESPKKK